MNQSFRKVHFNNFKQNENSTYNLKNTCKQQIKFYSQGITLQNKLTSKFDKGNLLLQFIKIPGITVGYFIMTKLQIQLLNVIRLKLKSTLFITIQLIRVEYYLLYFSTLT